MNERPAQSRSELAEWKKAVSPYRKPSFWRATWQILNTLGSYVLVWLAIGLSLGMSWWITAPLAVLAGGLMVRIFIILHDCGHRSYFRSKRANDFWGFVCGVLTFTPFLRWRRRHARHHASSGNLDRRTARQFVLPAAESAAMVFRKHRLPSRSSPQSIDTQLLSRAGPLGEPVGSRGAAAQPVGQPEVAVPAPLG